MKELPPLQRARGIARRQHSAIARPQLLAAGLSVQQVRTLVGRGDLEPRIAGVYVIAGSPDSWAQRAQVATLAHPGQLWLSHRAAAHLLGFDGFREPPAIEVVAARNCRPVVPAGAVLHRSDVLSAKDRTTHRSIPTINAAATLCQLAAVVDADRLSQAVDHVLRVGWSPRWVTATAQRWRRRGLPGPGLVIDLVDERVARRLPQSWFERLAALALRELGLVMQHEYPLRDASGRIVASLDLAAPRDRVGVECQSWEHHGTMTAAYRDTRRKRVVRRLGWEIVEVWWWDLERPDEILAEVAAAQQRQRNLG